MGRGRATSSLRALVVDSDVLLLGDAEAFAVNATNPLADVVAEGVVATHWFGTLVGGGESSAISFFFLRPALVVRVRRVPAIGGAFVARSREGSRGSRLASTVAAATATH